jgi:hypothetical protein
MEFVVSNQIKVQRTTCYHCETGSCIL